MAALRNLDVPALLAGVAQDLGHRWFTAGDFNLNVWGIRHPSDVADGWDDVLVACWREGGAWRWEAWQITTDPGKASLERPMRASGCAIMVPGQYKGSHRLGTHKGRPALQQVAPCGFWRDNDRDVELDRKGPVETAVIAANIHDAPGERDDLVGSWSAGCQVFRHVEDLQALLALVRKQQAAGLGDKISYTLVDAGDVPALRALVHLEP